WDAFILHARSRNIPLTLLEKAGLILPKQGGGYYDRFRNRLVFPIADMRGRILGFGARVLENSVPKYINSPETYIYSKGKHLYGLGASKERILGDDRVVVVEGYLDCLIPYQAGMRSVVASLGTALTPEQVRRIKRYTRNIVVVYDADTAGRLAALRSLDIFADEECEARVVSLPKGHDPDSFIRKEGLDAFRRLVNEAESVFSYKLNVLVSQYPVEDSQGKAKIASYMLETIGRFKNAVLVSEYVRRLAQKLDVSEEALRLELKKQKPGLRPSKTSLAAKAPRTYQCSRTEKLLVKLMLEEADLIHWVREHLEPADFQDARISRIVRLMFEMAAQGRRIEPCVLVSAMNEEDVSQIVCESLFLPEDVSYEQKEKIVGDCITRLKEEKVRNMRVRLQEQISAAQSAGDEAAVERLMNEFHGLIKQQG
ncbi:MAG: toprim domain-containing protein, partial [Candidatus Omnitrophica bacterium]|nr:toprim domain-containing protein [Candidatus Omnitrophota bacterium]